MSDLVVGYASGVFDMFHIGHLNILRRAREHCDYLVAGVATDEYVRDLKGTDPVIPFIERVEIVRSLRWVDEVVEDFSANKADAWLRSRFDVIFKGDDWRDSAKGRKLEAEMAEVGASVVYFPYTERTSSTILREYLEATITGVDAR